MKKQLWTARDKSGVLKIFVSKPWRDQMTPLWRQADMMTIPGSLFEEQTWKDEPIKVKVVPAEDGKLWLCRDGIKGNESDHYLLCKGEPWRSGSGWPEWDASDYFSLEATLFPDLGMKYEDDPIRVTLVSLETEPMKLDIHEPFWEKYNRWETMTEDQITEETGDPNIYRYWSHAKRGRLVIRLIEGGNPYMKVGDSLSGTTRAFNVGLPLVVEYPNGHYQSSFVLNVDWKNGTFCTAQSKYSFHFCSE